MIIRLLNILILLNIQGLSSAEDKPCLDKSKEGLKSCQKRCQSSGGMYAYKNGGFVCHYKPVEKKPVEQKPAMTKSTHQAASKSAEPKKKEMSDYDKLLKKHNEEERRAEVEDIRPIKKTDAPKMEEGPSKEGQSEEEGVLLEQTQMSMEELEEKRKARAKKFKEREERSKRNEEPEPRENPHLNDSGNPYAPKWQPPPGLGQ